MKLHPANNSYHAKNPRPEHNAILLSAGIFSREEDGKSGATHWIKRDLCDPVWIGATFFPGSRWIKNSFRARNCGMCPWLWTGQEGIYQNVAFPCGILFRLYGVEMLEENLGLDEGIRCIVCVFRQVWRMDGEISWIKNFKQFNVLFHWIFF